MIYRLTFQRIRNKICRLSKAINLIELNEDIFKFSCFEWWIVHLSHELRYTMEKKVLVSSINNCIIFQAICTLEPFQHTNFYLNKIHRWLIVHFKCFTQITRTHSTHLIHELKSIFDEIELRRIRIRMGFFSLDWITLKNSEPTHHKRTHFDHRPMTDLKRLILI